MFRIPDRLPIGYSFHRSGWPYVVKCMKPFIDKNAVLLDDFTEATFLYKGPNVNYPVYTEPWAGFFHHPHDAPCFMWPDQRLQFLWERREFQMSLPSLKLAFCLSDHLAEYLRMTLRCPVVSLKHPCEIPRMKWGDYEMPSKPRMLQFGWYLRDMRILARVPDGDYDKLMIFSRFRNQKRWMDVVCSHLGHGQYNVELSPYVENDEFDRLVCTSMCVARFLGCSAANGVVDCIVRNAPLAVNRHPAVVEYLGKDYPLYYDDPSEIPKLLDRCKEANEYLKAMDKSWTDGEAFARKVNRKVEEVLGIKEAA